MILNCIQSEAGLVVPALTPRTSRSLPGSRPTTPPHSSIAVTLRIRTNKRRAQAAPVSMTCAARNSIHTHSPGTGAPASRRPGRLYARARTAAYTPCTTIAMRA